ncbi:hypothetical protein EDD55_1112 [Varunaivibrio sulfuroxidans]|uniref:Sel1 repeat-containing protein n=1 Tax=Varunaivibrio sulfuroxidans TaxID=1773489 RepID=A0A4V2UN15_9PROT|nr:hypothetical protein EDD55_1112 [Varunaivibrio sulfuroxidans]
MKYISSQFHHIPTFFIRYGIFLLLFLSPVFLSPARGANYNDGLRAVHKDDWSRALANFRPLAKEGHAGALFSLGLMYQKGRGVKVDYNRALEYYLRAAVKDYAPAQNNIGTMYQEGLGVRRNFKEAIRWYTLAARAHLKAKLNLAQIYANGMGVKRDPVIAAKLYTLCAKENNPFCAFFLAQDYETGVGVAKDLKKAITYYKISAINGDEKALKRLKALGVETSTLKIKKKN